VLEIKERQEPSREMEKTFAVMARAFMNHLAEMGFEKGNIAVDAKVGFSCEGERKGVKVNICQVWEEAYGNDV
jgi:hypothetical protein